VFETYDLIVVLLRSILVQWTQLIIVRGR